MADYRSFMPCKEGCGRNAEHNFGGGICFECRQTKEFNVKLSELRPYIREVLREEGFLPRELPEDN